MDYIYTDRDGARWHVTSYGMTRDFFARRPGGSGCWQSCGGGYGDNDPEDQRRLNEMALSVAAQASGFADQVKSTCSTAIP